MEEAWNRELLREPVVEGLFYPEDPEELTTQIESHVHNARTVAGRPKGLIVPNAGFNFISAILGEAYKLCSASSYARIVILGPVRDEYPEGFLLPESTIFRTPAGRSRVDVPALQLLLSSSTAAHVSELAHLQEHSIEIQLPWIQVLFPDIPVVPILCNHRSPAGVKALASALYVMEQELPGDTLYIASMNFSPALPRESASRHAGLILEYLLEGKWEHLAGSPELRNTNTGNACIAAVLSLLLHRSCRVESIMRASSFEHDKNDSSVVEYAAVGFELPLEADSNPRGNTHHKAI